MSHASSATQTPLTKRVHAFYAKQRKTLTGRYKICLNTKEGTGPIIVNPVKRYWV